MTTLAIIGSGIAGRSLIYTLAKERKAFEKITLFSSDKMTPPCTLSSTAISALRGTTLGHSTLGDTIVEGFKIFSDHVELDHPFGVETISHYSAATKKLESFRARYPNGKMSNEFFKEETYVSTEKGYMIDTRTYGDWLLSESVLANCPLEIIEDMVIEVEEKERLHLKTLNGRNLSFDKVVFAGGNYNRFWKELAPESKLKTSKPSQGSYFEFNEVPWELPSFSMTLDGDNIVWNRGLRRLFVANTTSENAHFLAPLDELKANYERLSATTTLELPPIAEGTVRVGLREKAQKREPYLVQEGNKYFIGGYYKNAFTVFLKIARSLSHQLL